MKNELKDELIHRLVYKSALYFYIARARFPNPFSGEAIVDELYDTMEEASV